MDLNQKHWYKDTVWDPYSCNPDPGFLRKIYVEQNLYFIGQNCNMLLPNYRRSLLKKHPVLQNMKFLQFYPTILWVIFACLDPNLRGRDRDRDGNADPDQ